MWFFLFWRLLGELCRDVSRSARCHKLCNIRYIQHVSALDKIHTTPSFYFKFQKNHRIMGKHVNWIYCTFGRTWASEYATLWASRRTALCIVTHNYAGSFDFRQDNLKIVLCRLLIVQTGERVQSMQKSHSGQKVREKKLKLICSVDICPIVDVHIIIDS